ncbi:GGDEF domain-containing protein [Gayadomonas joobiniege]|uniref:GGDEF domain-containing protein n=1 Tax=Gayadomonas joobiniege TaxID=1234606 RepID=UPI00035CB4DA|nr:GGDEF domain-containing protein [Gayadomonas joobiniege]
MPFKAQLVNFFKSPHTNPKNVRKYALIKLICLFAPPFHILYYFVFDYFAQTGLAQFNLIGPFVWLAAYLANYRGSQDKAILIICSFILLYACVSVSELGYQTGFHYYLWPVSCLIPLSPALNRKQAIMTSALFVVLILIVNYVYFEVETPEFLLPYIKTLYAVNATIAFFPLILSILIVREVSESQDAELTRLATRDGLTGLYNRRYGQVLIEQTIKYTQYKQKGTFCLAIGDIDLFKQINDKLGHPAGDKVLKAVAKQILEQSRDSDIVCRWGGEEFVLVYMATDKALAINLLTRLKTSISDNIKLTQPDIKSVTLSFGLVEYSQGMTLEDLLKQADSLLYLAKDNGRDRVES